MPAGPASSLDGVLAEVLLDDVGLGTDVVVGLGVGETMVLAKYAVESQDELADEGPVRGVVVIAEEWERQPLLREPAAQPGPVVSARALGPVLDEPVDLLLDVRADVDDAIHGPIDDEVRARIPSAVVILLA